MNLISLMMVSFFPWTLFGYDRQEAIQSFKASVPMNAVVIDADPYRADLDPVDGKKSVCGVKFVDGTNDYYLETFPTVVDLEERGFVVTHFGRCGTCSTLQDLATYLTYFDMTSPVRKCGMKWGRKVQLKCLESMGLTRHCAKSWFYNIRNTRKHCLTLCLASYLKKDPYNFPDGRLNPCLQCDEDFSGQVFQASAGRTRRNSGIVSAIYRPVKEIKSIQHDYYRRP